jgi:hypothetical protein
MNRRRSARWLAAVLCGAACSWASISAQAEDSPVKGLKIVVPEAGGKAAYGKAQLTKAVRRALSEAIGPLISSKELKAAQKKLKHKGKALHAASSLAEAASTIDAQYVVSVELTKEKWLYTAHAQLINVETGEVQMDFRSQYFKPKSEAEDRGKRIGARVLQKLDQLLRDGPAPFAKKRKEPEVASAPDAPPAKREVDRPAGKRTDEPSEPPPAKSAPKQAEPERVAQQEPPPPPPPAVQAERKSSEGQTAAIEIAPTRVTEDVTEILRFTLTGGAGLLHTYDLASATVDSSRLSYRLDPLAMVASSAEVVIPSIGIGLDARFAYRPARLQVSVMNMAPNPMDPNAGRANTPAGRFFDGTLLLEAQISLSGSGRGAFKLIPAAGGKVGVVSVDSHPGAIILSSQEFAPIGSLQLRMPINEVLELDLGVDGGWILSYKESPAASGSTVNGGPTIGGTFSARIWLSSSIGVAFDTRFDYDRISFSGPPSRILPIGEMLDSVSLSTRDLRSGIGLALRL